MTRPTSDRDRALEYLGVQKIFLVDYPVIALGIRGGLSKTGQNTVGVFDDLEIILTGDRCEAFTGNTDPSTEIPGRANLVVGVHWLKPGVHHPGTPKAYAAFVQDGEIVVRRYQTESVPAGTNDERGECLGGGLWRGDFAIHLHNSMGENTTGSEGCQTIIKHEWEEYHTILLGELTAHQLTRFPYVLVDA